MKERPILFSAPMVKALLAGRKTQTRRIVRPPAACLRLEPHRKFYDSARWWVGPHPNGGWFAVDSPAGPPEYLLRDQKARAREGFSCPYGVTGDRLWVRETWRENIPPSGWIYRASDSLDPRDERPWRPSIFMPRASSRITLELTDVRVQRVQEISEEDALAEGFVRGIATGRIALSEGGFHLGPVYPNARTAYEDLWDEINGKRAPWSSNPWVWAISFRRVESSELPV